MVQQGAAVIEADENELVYEITFDIPDEGVLQMPLGEDRDDTSIPVIALETMRPTTKFRMFDIIQHELAGVWLAINLTTHIHHEQHSYNSERYERT